MPSLIFLGNSHPGGLENLENLTPIGEMNVNLVERGACFLDTQNGAVPEVLDIDAEARCWSQRGGARLTCRRCLPSRIESKLIDFSERVVHQMKDLPSRMDGVLNDAEPIALSFVGGA
ncbi:hypothetical protein D9M69_705080 [compost metagenome]